MHNANMFTNERILLDRWGGELDRELILAEAIRMENHCLIHNEQFNGRMQCTENAYQQRTPFFCHNSHQVLGWAKKKGRGAVGRAVCFAPSLQLAHGATTPHSSPLSPNPGACSLVVPPLCPSVVSSGQQAQGHSTNILCKTLLLDVAPP